MKKVLIDLIGEKFGKLSVLSRAENGSSNNARWNCVCECGTIKTVASGHLRTGLIVSCGCKKIERLKMMNTKHGASNTSEYYSWQNMIQRCTKKTSTSYMDYGGRGITVCKRWRNSYSDFIEDMGMKPSTGYSIERIDVNGNYEPNNCIWATAAEQSKNKRVNKNSVTGFSGISPRNGKWTARIGADNKRIFLGTFEDFEEAVQARKEAELKYWG